MNSDKASKESTKLKTASRFVLAGLIGMPILAVWIDQAFSVGQLTATVLGFVAFYGLAFGAKLAFGWKFRA